MGLLLTLYYISPKVCCFVAVQIPLPRHLLDRTSIKKYNIRNIGIMTNVLKDKMATYVALMTVRCRYVLCYFFIFSAATHHQTTHNWQAVGHWPVSTALPVASVLWDLVTWWGTSGSETKYSDSQNNSARSIMRGNWTVYVPAIHVTGWPHKQVLSASCCWPAPSDSLY